MQQSELLKGNLQTIVLKLLADNGKMYGYEITKRVKELSSGGMLLTEGALYPTLHKLEAEGFLNTETIPVGRRIRKYYNLTETGHYSVKDKINEFIDFVNIMNRILQLDPKTNL
jgi:PadR family transcriptional regulator, regulatory protein PadR